MGWFSDIISNHEPEPPKPLTHKQLAYKSSPVLGMEMAIEEGLNRTFRHCKLVNIIDKKQRDEFFSRTENGK